MTHRLLRLIACVWVSAALSFTALLPRADAAAGQVGCWSHSDTSPWNGSRLNLPDLRGLSAEAAFLRLKSMNQSCMVMNDKPLTVDPNAVVVARQEVRGVSDPDGVAPVVGLWLGVVLPDLTGQNLGAADEAVSQLGLVARPSPANGSAEWTVGRQSPATGAYMVFGDVVKLVLQELVRPVPVPDLVGHTEDEAEELVEAAKLIYVPRITKDGKRPGRVVSQQPRARELVAVGTRVTADIVRTLAVRLVVVPDVVGQDETKARVAIETVGLVFDPRIVKEGSGLGRVVWQSPTQGRQVPVRTAITVNIERSSGGQPPLRTVVPDVLGQQEPAARTAIRAARLKFQSRIIRPGMAAGRVLNQHPLAGTQVDVGSVVTVDLTREQSPELVPVPDLVDRSEGEARGAVERVRLIFDLIGGNDTSGRSRHVVRQVPPAGKLVAAGTTVTVELAADEADWAPWLLPLLIGVGLVAAGTAARLQLRRHHKRFRGPPQVRAVGRSLTLTSTRIQESGPAHRISVKPCLDRGRQYLQEEETDERF